MNVRASITGKGTFVRHRLHTGSGAHPAKAWSWPLTSAQYRD